MLTFDAPTHTYRFRGVVVPSVTQVLADLQDFSHVPPDTLERAQLRGTEVHLMCQWFDEDRLELSEFDPTVQVYLPAYERFLAEMRPNWLGIEHQVYHLVHGYAGTLDRRGGFETMPGDWVIDLKTSEAPHACWGLQTAAYAAAVGGTTPLRRATLQLANDGTYRFREWKDPTDWPTFLSLLNVNRWIRRNLS